MAHPNVAGERENRTPLPEGTVLKRRYEVYGAAFLYADRLVYRAVDAEGRRPVDVAEFCPQGLCIRAGNGPVLSPRDQGCGRAYFSGSEAFYARHTALMQAAGSKNIVPVYDAFFENGTVYAVTARAEGVLLCDYLSAAGRALTDGEFQYLLSALSDALLVVRSLSVTFGGVAMDTVLLGAGGSVRLTGCGAHAGAAGERGADGGDDVFDLGCLLYEAYTGRGFTGMDAFTCDGPGALCGILRCMLTNDPEQRFSGVFDLLHAAEGLGIAPEPPAVDARAARRRRQERAPYSPAPSLSPTLSPSPAAVGRDGGDAPRRQAREKAREQKPSLLSLLLQIPKPALLIGVGVLLLLCAVSAIVLFR